MVRSATGSGRGRPRPEILAAAVLGVAAAVAFVLCRLVSRFALGGADVLDGRVLRGMRATLGQVPGLRGVMLDITAFGDTATLTMVVLAVAGYLVARRRTGAALFLCGQALIGTAIASTVKPWFGRARPDVVEHWATFDSLSFPSGHAANASVVYLSLAMLAARGATDRAGRAYLAWLAAALVVAIGTSRLFLGVHWPTDVLAGWAIGAGWALATAACLDRWRRAT